VVGEGIDVYFCLIGLRIIIVDCHN